MQSDHSGQQLGPHYHPHLIPPVPLLLAPGTDFVSPSPGGLGKHKSWVPHSECLTPGLPGEAQDATFPSGRRSRGPPFGNQVSRPHGKFLFLVAWDVLFCLLQPLLEAKASVSRSLGGRSGCLASRRGRLRIRGAGSGGDPSVPSAHSVACAPLPWANPTHHFEPSH